LLWHEIKITGHAERGDRDVPIVARVIRQFGTGGATLALERAVILPATPTIGTRLDLRREGVEGPLEVVGITLLTESDRPSFLQPSVAVFTAWEPIAAAELARAGGWRDVEPIE
jgi:hypothetical protein